MKGKPEFSFSLSRDFKCEKKTDFNGGENVDMDFGFYIDNLLVDVCIE